MAQIAGLGITGTPITGPTGGSVAPGRDFLETFYTVTGDASFTDIDVYIAGADDPTLKVKVWRPNGADYDFIGESQSFSSFTNDATNNLVFNTPIAVLTDDIIGIHLLNGNGGVGVTLGANDTIWAVGDKTTNTAISDFSSTVSGKSFAMSANGTFTTPTGTARAVIAGQSLAEDFNTNGAITPNAKYKYYTGSAEVIPTTGTGANAIANAIIGAEGLDVVITNTGVGGTPLTEEAGDSDWWNRASGGSLWPDTVTRVNGLTAGANELDFMWWHQGTRDSLRSVSKADYLAAMTEFFTRVRAAFTGPGGTPLKILIAQFGRDTRGTATDVSHQAIRDAQIEYIASDANAYAVNAYLGENTDGVHATDAAYALLGEQVVATYYYANGDTTINAPKAVSADIGDTTSEIDIVFDSNLLTSDSAYSTEGIRVEADSVALTVLSFVRKNTTTATITVSETITSANVKAWMGYGMGGNASNTQLVYPRSVDAALPNSGGTFNINAQLFSELAIAISPNNATIDFTLAKPIFSISAGSVTPTSAAIDINISEPVFSIFASDGTTVYYYSKGTQVRLF